MLYLDTSFVAPLFLPEESSAAVVACVQGLPADELAVSNWTLVEFSSILARKVRMNELNAEQAADADSSLEAAIGAAFILFLPNGDDFSVARRFVQRLETSLRAPDALHLAIAANRGAKTIYSLDRKLIAGGAMLALPVSRGLRAS